MADLTPPPESRTSFTADDAAAVAAARAIALLAVESKGHGHAGTAMALAPLAHVLFHSVLRHDPSAPDWHGRDRFILSAGHASLLLYTQLHLTGYGITLDEIAKARTLASPRTPGHPELGHTPGVEMSTGPLGQGVATAVGLAAALRREAARVDVDTDEPLIDSTVWVLAGDGCLQEGVSAEASSLAGTLGLDNLVLLWDDNGITIDGPTSIAFREDVRARYRAYGWRVLEVDDVDNLEQVRDVLLQAKERTGVPTFVAVRTVIGSPAPNRAGTSAAHAGAFGPEETAAVLEALGYQPGTTLQQTVTEPVAALAQAAIERGRGWHRDWQKRLEQRLADAQFAAVWRGLHDADARRQRALDALAAIPAPEAGSSQATRAANGAAIKALHAADLLWGGSADLSDSTSVTVPGQPVAPSNPGGDFVPFGIREHAMAAFLSGVALHGVWRPYGSTYLAFSDYQRPALRLAALMDLATINVFTHDSVAVGEDGPTHQPVEQVSGLRSVPGLTVIRPGDSAEVLAAWRRIIEQPAGPVAIILSRQNLPVQQHASVPAADRGGYVLMQHGDGLDLAIVATGSEVHLAAAAGAALAADGIAVRVISMPSVEWFEAQDAAYREAVLPRGLRTRLVVEAGRTAGWWKYAGLDGAVLGIDGFGISGSGAEVLAHYGITADRVLAAARALLDSGAATPGSEDRR